MILLQAEILDALSSSWPLLMMVVVFYFFISRPQSKKRNEQKTFITDMVKGDRVVTNSGMIGKVLKIEDNVVTLLVDSKTHVEFLKSSISKEMTDQLKSADVKS